MRSSTRQELSQAVLGIRPVNGADVRHMATVAWNIARRMSNDQERIEDITAAAVHKAFLVIQQRRVYTVTALYRSIQRAALDYVKDKHTSHEISRIVWSIEKDGIPRDRDSQQFITEPVDAPWNKFHTQEGLADVLEAMTPRDVQIVTLVAEGRLLADVAVEVGMTRTAVASRLQRIRVWANKSHGEVLA